MALRDQLDEMQRETEKLRRLAEKGYELLKERYIADDLCDEGTDLYKELAGFLKKPIRDPINLTLTFNNFEIPADFDYEERTEYRIDIKDSKGNIISKDITPDDIDY